jgi:hypothetical protein
MLENHHYNLLEQIVDESKSLWRIRYKYKKDAEQCKECIDFWEKLEVDKEAHIKELSKLIKTHLR